MAGRPKDDWRLWGGGACPYPGALVDVITRNGLIYRSMTASEGCWQHACPGHSAQHDVVGFMVVLPP